jgi:hypothetical protein
LSFHERYGKRTFAAQFLIPVIYWLGVKALTNERFSPYEEPIFYYGIGAGLYFGMLIAGLVLLPALWKADTDAHAENNTQR